MKNIVWHQHKITQKERAEQNAQKPCALWFTGLSGSGKSTIAGAVEEMLFEVGCRSYLLDGDNIRHGLNKNLGFSDADRTENIRRVGEVSRLFVDAGMIVVTAFISPFESDRQSVRNLLRADEFIEVYLNTPLEVCESRDPKGLYQMARQGKIKDFTGVSSPYEVPVNPEIELCTAEMDVQACANRVLQYLDTKGYIHVY